MKKFITATLLKLMRSLIDGQLMDHIKELVNALMRSDMPGEKKRQALKEMLDDVEGDIKLALSETAEHLINAAIEIALMYLKARQ